MKKRFYSQQDMMKVTSYGDNMISEDRSAPCNLPRNVIEKSYENPYMAMGDIPADLYRAAQNQIKADGKDLKRIFKPGKY